jgi:hypothetical protein
MSQIQDGGAATREPIVYIIQDCALRHTQMPEHIEVRVRVEIDPSTRRAAQMPMRVFPVPLSDLPVPVFREALTGLLMRVHKTLHSRFVVMAAEARINISAGK